MEGPEGEDDGHGHPFEVGQAAARAEGKDSRNDDIKKSKIYSNLLILCMHKKFR